MNLQDIAELCEKARGPDKLLDAKIVIALDLRPKWCRDYGTEIYIDEKRINPDDTVPIFINTTGKRSAGHPSFHDYPPFTASIDDAMTLASPGMRRLVRDHDGKKDYDGTGKGKRGFASVYDKRGDGPIHSAYGATPALALCAAALRSRSVTPPDRPGS